MDGLFGKKEGQDKGFSLFKKKEEPAGPTVSDVLNQVNVLDRRLRILESRYTDLNRKAQVTEKNMLNERKIVTGEIRSMDSDILDLKRQINDLKNKVEMIISELKTAARKEDLEAIRKYVELWEPVNFVTRNEVENIINEKLGEKEK